MYLAQASRFQTPGPLDSQFTTVALGQGAMITSIMVYTLLIRLVDLFIYIYNHYIIAAGVK